MNPTIVWFRQDLRVEDQPALFAAISKGGPVIPLFVWCPQEEKEGSLGAASRWWLHHSLKSLQNELKTLNLHLIIRQQPALQALLAIAAQTGADTVLWNRRYEPSIMQQDGFIKAALHRQGIQTHSFNATLLFEPWDVANKKGKPFQVFTPFWKRCCQLGVTEPPLSKPPPAVKYAGEVDSEQVENLRLLPTVKWDQGFKESWQPGVSGAHLQLKEALPLIENYGGTRDFPAIQGTSQLSPYLHFGEISVRMVWFAVKRALGESKGVNAYLRQLGWREFAYHLLYHFPHTVHEPLRTNFTSFAWQKDEQALKAWQRGQTGYPLVDAGMRQLWQTGWMHNRVRMIVGSFLVKDLLMTWQEGAKWFWETLVDADLANNTLGWQWIAGCGADAAPYFRVFNPVTQSEKFDREGDYVRHWIPELAALPFPWIHQPWLAPDDVLRQAGVVLGVTYPYPIVDHAQARERALTVYAHMKEK